MVEKITILIVQLLTSFTATGLITFVVTHLHVPLMSWGLWMLHWVLAWPIAFVTVRWIAPYYQKIVKAWYEKNQSK